MVPDWRNWELPRPCAACRQAADPRRRHSRLQQPGIVDGGSLHSRELAQLMSLRLRRPEDVEDGSAANHERVRQQPAVTLPPQRLRAHDRRRPAGGVREQILYGGGKGRRLHVVGVAAEPFFTPGVVARLGQRPPASPESLEVPIADAVLGKKLLEMLPVEVPMTPGSRESPYISDPLDVVRTQDRDERLRIQVRMTDGVDHR